MGLKKVVVLTGAGISAESGLKTFRDADGLWEGHRIEDVATPEAWYRNQDLVLQFYNERRQQLKQAVPNGAHAWLTKLESNFDITIVTQNVDDLHERAGSKNIIHLHGELLKSRSEKIYHLVYPCTDNIQVGDLCEQGFQLRPHIVWFGEAVPLLETAARIFSEAGICIIIGTSLQVYPAAGLIHYLKADCPIYYIDPRPFLSTELRSRKNLHLLTTSAQEGMSMLASTLLAGITKVDLDYDQLSAPKIGLPNFN